MTDYKIVEGHDEKTLEADTIVNVVLDMSGSMGTIHEPTMSGFNEYINTLRQQENVGKALVSLLMFDASEYGGAGETRLIRPYTAIPLEDVPELTAKVYTPYGFTPLLDAVGANIEDTLDVLRRVKTKNPDVLNVIITDGGENSSKEYDNSQVSEMVQAREEEGWTFVYMGANQNSWSVASQFGLKQGNVMNFAASDIQEGAFKKAAVATATYRDTSTTMKARGLVGSYTTDNFFADAGVKEDEAVSLNDALSTVAQTQTQEESDEQSGS